MAAKEWAYTATFVFKAQNFEKAKAHADDIDKRLEKSPVDARKLGESRLREIESGN